MFRKQDLDTLKRIHDRSENNFVLVFGNELSETKDLINTFIKDKDFFYYKAIDVDFNTQIKLLCKELNHYYKNSGYINSDYENLISNFLSGSSESKKVFIIDDFTYLVSANPTFINYLFSVAFNSKSNDYCTFILISKDYNYITKDFSKIIGKKAYDFSAVIDLTSFSFDDFAEYTNNKIDFKEALKYYSVLGGNSLLWSQNDFKNNFKSFLIDDFLGENSIYFEYGNSILPKTLRSNTVYNSILYNLANQNNKLSDIYTATNIDRAKLSVYINTLVSYNLIEKCIGLSIGKESNIKKGFYRIKNPFICFWYKFIFPNLSSLFFKSNDKFYRKNIEPELYNYILSNARFYIEYILKNNKKTESFINGFPNLFEYFDKSGLIDFILCSDSSNNIVCSINKSNSIYNLKDYDQLKKHLAKINLPFTKIIIISYKDFGDSVKALENEALILITLT